MIPERLVLGVAKAKFEGDAAKYERQQHQEDREIARRNDDRESQRKGGEQSEATEDEPRLVSVPDRRNRIHHDVARGGIRCEPVKYADAEIEPIEQHV